jgi:hypothetical protein
MKRFFWLGIGLSVAAPVAFAQELLEDLTRINAKKLNTEEIRALIVGTTSSGPGLKNTYSNIMLHPDGKASGYILVGGRNFMIADGTYKVTDDGKACFHYEFNGGIPPYDGCMSYYEKDTKYYLVFSDTDPKSQILKREFKR